jgi:zinc transporter ZupT
VTIGSSIFLIAVGAILRYAVTATVSGVDIQVVGLILMIAGLIGLVIGLFMMTAGRSDAGPPPPPPVQ